MEGATTGMEWVTSGTETVVTWFESVLGIITGNELLAACLVAGTVVPIGCYLLRKFRGAV